jgi:hypothetical protein
VFTISALTGEGCRELSFAVAQFLAEQEAREGGPGWQPAEAAQQPT